MSEAVEVQLQALLDRMQAKEVASRDGLVGCSPDEIAALEARYGVELPFAYRRYLEIMGHDSGRLFTHDHVAVTYDRVLGLTDEFDEHFGDTPENPDRRLPSQALVVLGRLGEQFLFLVCDRADDSEVFHIASDPDLQPQLSHRSVVEWLNAWCDEAELAIMQGYYEKYPSGTSP